MASMDMHNTVNEEIGLATTTIGSNTTTNGLSVDMNDGNGYEGLEFFVLVAAFTDGDYALSLEESDDDSIWVAVSTANTIGASTVSAAGTARTGYVGKKQFARLVVTSTNTTTGADLTAMAVKGFARHNPTA